MESVKKHPLPSAEEENLQQALYVIWVERERGSRQKDTVTRVLTDTIGAGILEKVMTAGYVAVSSQGEVSFTPRGESLAHDMARRHRLTERLLQDVLVVSEEEVDPNVCRMEHVITGDVEEAICTLLGHPQACPHGLAIPTGRCCEKALEFTESIVFPLAELAQGEQGRILYFTPQKRPELHKLLSMGFVPGEVVGMSQVSPAFVVKVGEMLIALDKSLAQHIFVRRQKNSHNE